MPELGRKGKVLDGGDVQLLTLIGLEFDVALLVKGMICVICTGCAVIGHAGPAFTGSPCFVQVAEGNL